MLRSTIIVDLPSAETDRKMGPLEWVRSLFGARIDLRSGREELTVGALSLVEGLVKAFSSAGVTDAISFLVDRKVIYFDTHDVADDITLILEAAERTGVLERKFREMHVVLSHRTPTMHTLLDCAIKSEVLLGEAEMVVVLSSRLPDLQVREGETAQDYAERVKAFGAEENAFEPYRLALDGLAAQVTAALSRTLVGAVAEQTPAVVQLIRPEAKQVGRFRGLGFGENVEQPSYRGVPTTHRNGAYADPYYYYYHDPYYDFMSYMLISSMLHQSSWHSHHVHVVDPAGQTLYSGADVPSDATSAAGGWVGDDAVAFDADGGVVVSDSVPESSSDTAWSEGSPSTDDSSKFDTGSSCSSASGDSSGSTDSSASSCGSSCSSSSGSSCGSSCSSGSD